MLYSVGKFYDYMNEEHIEKYEAIHGDILWYLLDVTKVNRFFTQSSLREFLTRYFLITKHDLTQSASKFIDNGILISGTLETDYFEFTLQDLIHFFGFEKSKRKFNVDNFLVEFIKDYKYKELTIKYEKQEGSKIINVNTDTLGLILMGLGNLLKIDSLSIEFKEDLKNSTEAELTQVTKFVDYIISTISLDSYVNQLPKFKGQLDWMEEYYDISKKIIFDPYLYLSRETFMKIAVICQEPASVSYYESFETMDEDFKSDFSIVNEHIIFAYGVKHGHIRLSTDQSSSSAINNCYDSYFDIDEQYINEEGFVFPTQFIYDDWKMEQWIDLLP
jgi:hypothetical protein